MTDIKNKKINIIIIGTGWYGCHIASFLKNKNKYNITIIEKNSEIFNNSSYYNQNRLHLGFHYPRDYNTRTLCKSYYDIFCEKYGECVEHIDNNYYAISNQSIIDYTTFLHIYKHENFEFENVNNDLFDNIKGDLFLTKEDVINSTKSKQYFIEELKDVKIVFNTKISRYEKNGNKIVVYDENNNEYNCDLLIDCTYNQLGISTIPYLYEMTISLLFKKTSDCKFGAFTVMDGKFISLYPRDIENQIYTLTDVEFTPLKKSYSYNEVDEYIPSCEEIEIVKQNIISKMKTYYPDFEKYFEYDGYFLSKKTKQLSSSDSRDITIEEIEPNVITVNCGKIYGIFEFEKYVNNYIQKIEL
jgi:hypothetical protein